MTRLSLQPLEAREVPAITLVGTELQITCGDSNDDVTVTAEMDLSESIVTRLTAKQTETRIGASGQTYTLTNTRTFWISDVKAVYVTLGNGTNSYTGDHGITTKVHGGLGDDTMVGTSGAWGGTDIFHGHNGNDTLKGGFGNDFLLGGNGDDTLYGGDGDDAVSAGEGNNTAYGGNGEDTITGGTGNDFFHGGFGDDVIRGGDGHDKLYGGGDDDRVYGEGGNDTMYGQDGTDWLYGGTGDDYLVGGMGFDFLDGEDGFDVVFPDEPYQP